MTAKKKIVLDLSFLAEASKRLHGYFLLRWFAGYFRLIIDNEQRLMDLGAIGPDARPSRETDYLLTFDNNALDLHAMTDLLGQYFYILSGHKKSNYYLMKKNKQKRILYLRGFDYEGAASSGQGAAFSYGSMDTMQFNFKLGDALAADFPVFKALSSMDLYWETAAEVSNYFYEDWGKIIEVCSEPIRSLYLNANCWQEDMAQLVDRMNYFVVYVSSITGSLLWELDLLERKHRCRHATVVFDREAIAIKGKQTKLQAYVKKQYKDRVRWSIRGEVPGITADELHDRLARKFLVVSPDEFFAEIDLHRDRIARAKAPVGPGAREAPVEFRFYPAVSEAELQRIRDFNESLNGVISRQISSRGITNLPWFLNQVQMMIFTTVMLGDHHETGRALVIYAAVMDVIQKRMAAKSWPGRELPPEQRAQIRDKLKQHFENADYISYTLLSYGRSDQFGDFRARAEKIYDELFAAASEAVKKFFEEAQRRAE